MNQYQLIKNLPRNFLKNINPKDYYPKIQFDREIATNPTPAATN